MSEQRKAYRSAPQCQLAGLLLGRYSFALFPPPTPHRLPGTISATWTQTSKWMSRCPKYSCHKGVDDTRWFVSRVRLGLPSQSKRSRRTKESHLVSEPRRGQFVGCARRKNSLCCHCGKRYAAAVVTMAAASTMV